MDGWQQKAADPTEIHLDPWTLPDSRREAQEEFIPSVTHHISREQGSAAQAEGSLLYLPGDAFSASIICIPSSCSQDVQGRQRGVDVCAIPNTRGVRADTSVTRSARQS